MSLQKLFMNYRKRILNCRNILLIYYAMDFSNTKLEKVCGKQSKVLKYINKL